MDFRIEKIYPEDYPTGLLEIPDIPASLNIVGTPLDKNALYLCVVGSRNNTTYGKSALEELIAGLANTNIVIVSGLALGTDTIAHKLALKYGLKTVVFPGSGLGEKVLYPASNLALAKEILAAGGTLVSEYENNFHSMIWTFSRRNRLMAGLSHATLIVEAGEKSGTLITARLALDYNREVLVVPGPITSPVSIGSNRLLRQGAIPITKSEDILEVFGMKQKSLFSEKDIEMQNLSADEKEVLEFLIEPCSRDEILKCCGKPVNEINCLLSAMEIKGLIKEEMGEIRRI